MTTDLETAWSTYEAASRRAHVEYLARPSAKPFVAGLNYCLGCDVLTELDVCLSCQSRSEEWAALASNPRAVAEFRRLGREMTSEGLPVTSAAGPLVGKRRT